MSELRAGEVDRPAINPPPPDHPAIRFARFLGYVWASPLVFLSPLSTHGFPAALPVLLLLWWLGEVRPRGWSEGAWEWSVRPKSWIDRHRGRFVGFTAGWIILYAPDAHRWPHIRKHERRHVLQGMIFGPLLPLVYLAASAWALLRGRRAYDDNALEVDARSAGDAPS